VFLFFLVPVVPVLLTCAILPTFFDEFYRLSHSLYSAIFVQSQRVDIAIVRWYLAGVLVNIVSIISAIFLVFKKDGHTNFDLSATIAFTVLGVFSIGSLVLADAPFVDFNMVTAITFSVYTACDIYGMNYESPKGDKRHKFYRLPFWCLDLPSTVVSWYFVAIHRLTPSELPGQFYPGVGAALMVFAAACYVTLLTVVLDTEAPANQAAQRGAHG